MFPMKLLDKQDYKFRWTDSLTKIGLDGKGVQGHKMVHNITNLNDNEIIGIFANLSQKELKQKLLQVDEKSRNAIKEVATDMDPFYINIARECFPNARIVIDHFHVIQWGIKLMNDQRGILQNISKKRFAIKQIICKPQHKLSNQEYKKLQDCFAEFSELKVSWKIIHQLRKIYWQKNWKKADSQLRKVLWYCEQSCIPEMITLSKTLKKHHSNILNYYISKTTNAYTEGVHNRFETIKRNHCGVRNIERFAKRLIFCFLPFSVIMDNFISNLAP